MDFLEYIKKIDEKELEKVVNERIEELEEDEFLYIPDTIGYKLDYNPSSFILNNIDLNNLDTVEIRDYYEGYIPYGTRIVYGIVYKEDKSIKSNGSRYYYIDDDSYILEFCKYIRKEEEIEGPYTLFDRIHEFIQDYFGRIVQVDRETMMNYVLKKDYYFYDPVNENTLSMFKNKGNALCSERGLLAQNILSFLGFDTTYIMGTIKRILTPCLENTNFSNTDEIRISNYNKIEDMKKDIEEEMIRKEKWERKKEKFSLEGHAYNMVTFEEQDELVSLLIDFSAGVNVFNMKHQKIGETPFIEYLDKEKYDKYIEMKLNNKGIEAYDYSYIVDLPLAIVVNEASKREYKTATDLGNVGHIKKYTKENM